MHFTESQYIHKYYTLSGVFATLGGLLSSINLATGWLLVIYIMTFLLRLTKTIKGNMEIVYKSKTLKFFDQTNEKLVSLKILRN